MEGSDVLGIAAIIISLLSFGFSVWSFFLSGPALRLEVSEGSAGPGYPFHRAVRVDLWNKGRADAHVARLILRADNSPVWLTPTEEMIHGPALPLVVKPNERVVWLLDYMAVETEVIGWSPGQRHLMRARAEYGTRTAKSRSTFAVEETVPGQYRAVDMKRWGLSGHLAIEAEAPQPRLHEGRQRLTIRNKFYGPAFKIRLDMVRISILDMRRKVDPSMEPKALGWLRGFGQKYAFAPIGEPRAPNGQPREAFRELQYWRIAWVDILGRHHEQVTTTADEKFLRSLDEAEEEPSQTDSREPASGAGPE